MDLRIAYFRTEEENCLVSSFFSLKGLVVTLRDLI